MPAIRAGKTKFAFSFSVGERDTARASPDDFCPWETAPFVVQTTYAVQPRSVVIPVLPLEVAA
jgi:hypothetical protein